MRVLATLGVYALLAPALASAANPDWYIVKETWQATMRASLEAFDRGRTQEPGDRAFEPFTSDVMRGGQAAQRVVVSVSGVQQLTLIASGVPDYHGAHADWGDAKLTAADGSVVYLSDLEPIRVSQPYGLLRRDHSHRGGPIRIATRQFERGLGTHAFSEICFALDGKYQRFEAWIGLDETSGSAGGVRFTVTNQPDAEIESVRGALWRMVQGTFPDHRREMDWEREDGVWSRPLGVKELANRYAVISSRRPDLYREALKLAADVCDEAALENVRGLYLASRGATPAKSRRDAVDLTALRLAIVDLMATFPQRYPGGREYLDRLVALEQKIASTSGGMTDAMTTAAERLRRDALLSNPLLDFDRLLLVKRRPWINDKPGDPTTTDAWAMGMPRSSYGNSGLPRNAYDNEIAVLSPVAPDGKLTTLYRGPDHRFVGDIDLHFDAQRMLFSMRDERGMFQVFELGVDGSGLRQVTLGDQADVDHYDACYLPDERIALASTACFQGVPCNKSDVAVLYRIEADGGQMRQLCFEQDHDFNPSLLPSGQLLYTRWEYSDLPHSNSRMMFTMNPDGTSQAAYYGGSSYWPNSIFAARCTPGSPARFVGIVAGHHGSHREGELVLFDVGQGRQEARGAVQRIPGRGRKVEPIVRDQLTAASWPKFAHPWPLSDKYFLVSMKLDSQSPWGVYLVDVFDNLVPLHYAPGFALFEPIPLRATERPPVIPDRVDPTRRDAVVYLADVYHGPGLAGIPRGTVKRLRLFTYHFAYQGMGGLLGTVGLDGPWDIKRVLGSVPVETDGSALFRVPANTPISVQPLDAEGKALQLMRSWFVGMPGETVSCVGCHQHQDSTAVNLDSIARGRPPSEITPWYGPPRNFSYRREVQPLIDRHCVACHDGQTNQPDLRGTELTSDYHSNIAGNGGGAGGRYFSVGYRELARYVRRPGIESDIHMLPPMEFHADTTQLVQLLQKGHHNVQLDKEAWDRIVTWIDLNAPYHGTWTEIGWDPGKQRQRRRRLRELYAGVDEDPESLLEAPPPQVDPIRPPPYAEEVDTNPGPIECPGWPLDPLQAAQRQREAGPAVRRTIDLGNGVELAMTLVPPGEFVMGDVHGYRDERPRARVRIDRPFWIGQCEVTNRQFARFDPSHDSRFESKNGYQFGVTGFALDGRDQPVVRVSWDSAQAFCRWLSDRLGERFELPSEAQWEYACRAGSPSSFFFGGLDDDFSPFANTADVKLRDFASDPYTIYKPLDTFTPYDDWIPRDRRFDDGGLVTVDVGRYEGNAWGIHDTAGNVAEWTGSLYRPYPYDPQDGREEPSVAGKRVVRGGSWRDRPQRCRSAFRLGYPAWQRVYNVGFRVICEF